jgi:activator of 2-hydroxyglutaryl-CoA dehydratase
MVRQMAGRESFEGLFFAGGGAQNAGVRAALESALGRPVFVPPDPQYVVATGAALIAAGMGGRHSNPSCCYEARCQGRHRL